MDAFGTELVILHPLNRNQLLIVRETVNISNFHRYSFDFRITSVKATLPLTPIVKTTVCLSSVVSPTAFTYRGLHNG